MHREHDAYDRLIDVANVILISWQIGKGFDPDDFKRLERAIGAAVYLKDKGND